VSTWPTMSDYQEAVQNPKNCFSDAELQRGTPTLNALGLPQPVTGGFCSVYQLTAGKTRWAVRCFLHNIKDIQDRYHQISKHLKSKKMKQLVGFGYVKEGIRVRGQWYPVLKMEWVDGLNLDRWVEKNLRDTRALRKFSERWAELMEQLEQAKIGHCDLQHGNVLVDSSNSVKLIDYDGMYVPSLRGRGSHEKGHPAYQHPEREGSDFDESVDRFSALVIQASLLALAEKPELWKKYNEEDNLIFKRADFQSPDSAPVFKDLEKMGGTVAALSEALREACKVKVGKSPRLREVRNGKPPDPIPLPTAQNAPATRPAPAPRPAPAVSQPSAPKPSPPPPAPVAAKAPAPPPKASPPPPAKVIPLPAQPAKANTGKAKNKSRRAKSQRAKSQPASPPPPRPTGTQPGWIGSLTQPARAKSRPASAPAAAVASQPAAAPAARAVSRPAAKAVSRPASKAVSRPALAPVPRTTWAVEWQRPGLAKEQHTWKLPVYGRRDAPSYFLGMQVGTHKEKFVERYDERNEERKSWVQGHHSMVTSLAFSHDGRLLASGARDRTVRVWNVQSGREETAALETRAGVVALALMADRSMIAAVLEDKKIVLWDFGLHRSVVHFDSPDGSRLNAIAVSKDGRFVAAGGSGRSIFIWQTDRGTIAGDFRRTIGSVEALAFTADASGIVCGTNKGRLELYERGHEQARWSVRTGLGRIVSLAVPHKTSGALTGGAGGTVALWDLKDGSEKQRVRPMRGRLTSLSTTPDASHLLVGLAAGKACLTERATEREVAVLDGHKRAVTAVALSSTGKFAATGAGDGSVRLWVAP
jgi:WD40 domain-containing protein/protein kinase-like protein